MAYQAISARQVKAETKASPQTDTITITPTLSLPGVQSITANSAVPKVTLTW